MAKALAKGSRITGAQRGTLAAEYAKRYAAGESIRTIAGDAGRSFGFVHGVLKEEGVELRGRGGATRRAKDAAPAERAAAGPSAAGAPPKEIARSVATKATKAVKTAAKKSPAKKSPAKKVAAEKVPAKTG